MKFLRQAVTSINNQVMTSRERRGVTSQVQISSLELSSLALTSMYDVSQELATSEPVCTHPATVFSLKTFLTSSLIKSVISVLMYPGDTVLTRAKPVHSTAIDLPISSQLYCAD